MAIVERVSQDDLIFYEILKNPVLCNEFINNLDVAEWEEPFEFTYYQKDILCDFNPHVSICTARATGKCLHKDSKILNPKTGEVDSVENWFFRQDLSSIVSIDENLKQQVGTTYIEPNGIKDCIEIKTSNGFKTTVTEEHPLLTNRGFVEANKLKIGDFIAVPIQLNYFGTSSNFTDNEIKILAHFIAEGTYHVGSITTTESEVIQDIYDYAKEVNLDIRQDKITYFITNHNSKSEYLKLLERCEIRNCHSYDKFIPKEIFKENKKHISLFLQKLFDDDGWCLDDTGHIEVGYGTTSEKLARDIKHLLLRFGVQTSLSYKKNKKLGSWNLSIKGFSNLVKFKNDIGFSVDRKKEKLDSSIIKAEEFKNQADLVPIPNYRKYKYPKKDLVSGKYYPANIRYFPSRQKAKNILNIDEELYKFINADIYWVKVKELNKIEKQETYSVEINKYNTHVVDDIYSHNTVSEVSLITWLLVLNIFPDNYIVYTVPSKVHLLPVWQGLMRVFRSNSFLKQLVSSTGGFNSSDYRIELSNRALLLCRIAGQTGTGANVIGLHTPFILLDEGGYYPHPTWVELQPTLNTFTQGYRLMVAGVPTGIRENNILYIADQEDSSYSKHRVSAYENPRFTSIDEQYAMDQYGGKEADDFIHLVLGLHGSPIFALFDRNLMEIGNYPVYKLTLDGIKLREQLEDYIQRVSVFPSLKSDKLDVIMGIDLGYTEPTAIVIMYQDNLGRIRFHGRIQLNKVSYNIQDRLIDLLDTKFKPSIIGVDEGSAGKAVIQRLQESEDFIHKDYKNRLIPINFSSSIVLGHDLDGEEIKSKTKPFSVSVLQEYTNNHKIIYSSTDLELVTELERMTYSKNPSGDIAYKTLTARGGKKGDDHFTSALLCASLAYYLTNEELTAMRKPVKLASSRWVL